MTLRASESIILNSREPESIVFVTIFPTLLSLSLRGFAGISEGFQIQLPDTQYHTVTKSESESEIRSLFCCSSLTPQWQAAAVVHLQFFKKLMEKIKVSVI